MKKLPEPTAPLMFLTDETSKKMQLLMELLDSEFDTRDFVVKQTSKGKKIRLRSLEEFLTKLGEKTECPLGELLPDPENEGKKMIRPGYIHAGGSSILLEKNNITPAIGSYLYIKVSWTAIEEDDVLLPGGSMTAATIEIGSSLPDDDTFSATSLIGHHYRVLGQWIDSNNTPKFIKEGCGSYSLKFCPAGFLGLRG